MSGRAHWSYVQARLQARHGEHLDEGDWRTLETAKSLDHFLERSRATVLRRFTERLNAEMSSHTIERILRAAWRQYVAEVAAWTPSAWQPAVHWVAHISDLPLLDRLLEGDAPDWARQDPMFALFVDDDVQKRIANLQNSPFAPLSAAAYRYGMLTERWLAHWRALWPRQFTLDRQMLNKLIEVIGGHFERLGRAGAQDTSHQYRRDLARTLTRTFRRGSGTSIALFSHLALVALDLERLRGGLVRRRVFEIEYPKRAA